MIHPDDPVSETELEEVPLATEEIINSVNVIYIEEEPLLIIVPPVRPHTHWTKKKWSFLISLLFFIVLFLTVVLPSGAGTRYDREFVNTECETATKLCDNDVCLKEATKNATDVDSFYEAQSECYADSKCANVDKYCFKTKDFILSKWKDNHKMSYTKNIKYAFEGNPTYYFSNDGGSNAGTILVYLFGIIYLLISICIYLLLEKRRLARV